MNCNYYPTDFRGLSLPVTQGKFHKVCRALRHPLEKLICLHRINHVYARAASAPDQWQFLTALLQSLNVHYNLAEEDLSRIPARGAVVVVANHPFGGVEGIILPALLGRVRRDVKVLANYLLRPVTELQDLFIYVDPFGGEAAARSNLASLKKALLWLQARRVAGSLPGRRSISPDLAATKDYRPGLEYHRGRSHPKIPGSKPCRYFLPGTMALCSNAWG